MPKFTVTVTKDITASATVEVEADTQEEAAEKGLNLATDHPDRYEWTPDEDSFHSDPYLPAGDDSAEPEDIATDETRSYGPRR
jgi:hypothetical protein